MNASVAADYASWERRFRSYLSSVDNRSIEKALNTLCNAGCKKQALLNRLWDYAEGRIDPSSAIRVQRQAGASSKQFCILARCLHQTADALARLKQSLGELIGFHCDFVEDLDRSWGGDLEKRLYAASELVEHYALAWKRAHTIKKVKSRADFALARLCEYVKARTSRPHHKELALLLEAAWAGYGRHSNWSIDKLRSRLRRVGHQTRKAIANAESRPMQTTD